MSRITVKCNNEMGYGYKEYSSESSMAITRKLGQLEDIEEDLGIDLALRHKIETSETAYIKNGNDEIIKGTVECFYSKLKAFGVMCQNEEYGNVLIACHINELGKTWALTREELQ